MQLLQLLAGHAGGGLGHQAAGLLGLGEGDRVADRFLAGQQHRHAVEAEGEAPKAAAKPKATKAAAGEKKAAPKKAAAKKESDAE